MLLQSCSILLVAAGQEARVAVVMARAEAVAAVAAAVVVVVVGTGVACVGRLIPPLLLLHVFALPSELA